MIYHYIMWYFFKGRQEMNVPSLGCPQKSTASKDKTCELFTCRGVYRSNEAWIPWGKSWEIYKKYQ